MLLSRSSSRCTLSWCRLESGSCTVRPTSHPYDGRPNPRRFLSSWPLLSLRDCRGSCSRDVYRIEDSIFLEISRKFIAGLAGFEPATHGPGNRLTLLRRARFLYL